MSRRAKIVCTLGPASSSPEELAKLVAAGLDVARLNMSHGSQAGHLEVYRAVRRASDEAGRSVGVLVDLQGPKIRLGSFASGPVRLAAGQSFTITGEDVPGDSAGASTTYPGLAADVRAGDQILVDDGRVVLEVTAARGERVETRVLVGGTVSDHKGLNVPGARLSVPALSEKDEQDLRWALGLRADMIALSFVQGPEDAAPVRAIMDEVGARLPLIAKIEKPRGGPRAAGGARGFRRDHGGTRRSGRGASARAGADGSEASDQAGQGQGQARHRGDADARVNDLRAEADSSRGVRRGQRGA
jgi:pyruvate kinase